MNPDVNECSVPNEMFFVGAQKYRQTLQSPVEAGDPDSARVYYWGDGATDVVPVDVSDAEEAVVRPAQGQQEQEAEPKPETECDSVEQWQSLPPLSIQLLHPDDAGEWLAAGANTPERSPSPTRASSPNRALSPVRASPARSPLPGQSPVTASSARSRTPIRSPVPQQQIVEPEQLEQQLQPQSESYPTNDSINQHQLQQQSEPFSINESFDQQQLQQQSEPFSVDFAIDQQQLQQQNESFPASISVNDAVQETTVPVSTVNDRQRALQAEEQQLLQRELLMQKQQLQQRHGSLLSSTAVVLGGQNSWTVVKPDVKGVPVSRATATIDQHTKKPRPSVASKAKKRKKKGSVARYKPASSSFCVII